MPQPQSWLHDLSRRVEDHFAMLLQDILDGVVTLNMRQYGAPLQTAVNRLRDRLEQDRLTIIEAREAQCVAEARLLALQNQQPAPAAVTLPAPKVGMRIQRVSDGQELEVLAISNGHIVFDDRSWWWCREWSADNVKTVFEDDAESTTDPDSEPLP